ncbi:hypothetical protein M438DRAFT_360506 [Aureobasidium pullulans EXF-150]|uniref:Uncharacterized protein n=1 Tax=Aureobasidium pullulans EXF-150 TaxID=1043002 RepID=A0A074X8M7_AURPU|nr:uncharacterized protein M438DRAFT_360506 [Aureobasidium pullulans EXF-150]KEQ78407.1 hypothetical protein M438DRAFT_360506 [Aureobasidium pullulans EXF-150]
MSSKAKNQPEVILMAERSCREISCPHRNLESRGSHGSWLLDCDCRHDLDCRPRAIVGGKLWTEGSLQRVCQVPRSLVAEEGRLELQNGELPKSSNSGNLKSYPYPGSSGRKLVGFVHQNCKTILYTLQVAKRIIRVDRSIIIKMLLALSGVVNKQQME